MLLSKFSGDNLAEDLMKPEVWRKTFKLFPIMELVKLREVCSTFKDEVDFLFATQTKLGIFGSMKPRFKINFCQDPLHDIPVSSWIRMDKPFIEYLSSLKSMFPSVKVLCINYGIACEIGKVLESFVELECLAISDYVWGYETNFPYLKHLITTAIFGGKMICLPSLESLEIKQCFDTIEPWLKMNVGRPSKRFVIGWFSNQFDPNFSFQCLSSLPSSLEYLKTRDFKGYSRRLQPLFPRLREVERLKLLESGMDFVVTAFIDFLKDHRLTLKKVSTHLNDVNVDQLEEMLSCLQCETHVTLIPCYFSKDADYVRIFLLIGRQCREKNLVLKMKWNCILASRTLDEILRFVDILPSETQSLQLAVHGLIFTDETSCRRYIQDILASPLRSTTLRMDETTEEIRRAWTSAVQGLSETHEAILEFFEPKPQRVIIRRRN